MSDLSSFRTAQVLRDSAARRVRSAAVFLALLFIVIAAMVGALSSLDMW